MRRARAARATRRARARYCAGSSGTRAAGFPHGLAHDENVRVFVSLNPGPKIVPDLCGYPWLA
eukprot:11132599-Lingulodinium_polyedra.AAC.1